MNNETCIPITAACVAGCECAPNLVQNGTHCVLPSSCSCRDDQNRTRDPSETWQDGEDPCKKCTCFNNRLRCWNTPCPVVTCPPNSIPVKVDGKCCPECQQISTPTPTTPVCTPNQKQCPSGKCIQDTFICDGEYDCASGWDERNCPTSQPPCFFELGVSNPGRIPDDNLQASTSKSFLFDPSNGRLLSLQKPGKSAGGWEAQVTDNQPWIEVDLGRIVIVTKISTQGRNNGSEFVKTYGFKYSIFGNNWRSYQENGNEKEFRCNTDSDTVVSNKLRHRVRARYFRIYVEAFHNAPALRFELYGCNETVTTTSRPTTTTTCPGFQCVGGDRECLPSRWECDGEPDCVDQSDEWNCTCRSDQFKCQNGPCINKKWVCDNVNDCADGSDERNCPTKPPCNQFTCTDGTCISLNKTCDGTKDCNDGIDEKLARCPTKISPTKCTKTNQSICCEDEFLCFRSKTCIPKRWKCDNHKDCRHGEDEDCCANDKCTCPGSGKCINCAYFCDIITDCPGGEDERPPLCNLTASTTRGPTTRKTMTSTSTTSVTKQETTPKSQSSTVKSSSVTTEHSTTTTKSPTTPRTRRPTECQYFMLGNGTSVSKKYVGKEDCGMKCWETCFQKRNAGANYNGASFGIVGGGRDFECFCETGLSMKGNPWTSSFFTCKAEDISRFCARKKDGNYENPNDCSSFIMCSNGRKHVMDCPSNLYFNIKTNKCDWQANVTCLSENRCFQRGEGNAKSLTKIEPANSEGECLRQCLMKNMSGENFNGVRFGHIGGGRDKECYCLTEMKYTWKTSLFNNKQEDCQVWEKCPAQPTTIPVETSKPEECGYIKDGEGDCSKFGEKYISTATGTHTVHTCRKACHQSALCAVFLLGKPGGSVPGSCALYRENAESVCRGTLRIEKWEMHHLLECAANTTPSLPTTSTSTTSLPTTTPTTSSSTTTSKTPSPTTSSPTSTSSSTTPSTTPSPTPCSHGHYCTCQQTCQSRVNDSNACNGPVICSKVLLATCKACPDGYKLNNVTNQCIPELTCDGCVRQGKYMKVGEFIKDASSCKTCFCKGDANGGLSCTSYCPIDSCGNNSYPIIPTNGCCYCPRTTTSVPTTTTSTTAASSTTSSTSTTSKSSTITSTTKKSTSKSTSTTTQPPSSTQQSTSPSEKSTSTTSKSMSTIGLPTASTTSPAVCRYNDRIYQIGEKWNTSCEACTCILKADGNGWITCVDQISNAGKTSDQAGMYYKRETDQAREGCRMEEELMHVTDAQHCVSAVKVKQTSCSGQCRSSTRLASDFRPHIDCRMCSAAGVKKQRVMFICQDGSEVTRDHVYFTDCICRACSNDVPGVQKLF